jgi:hypothetical protein
VLSGAAPLLDLSVVPSQTAVYNYMLAQESHFLSSDVTLSKAAVFLNKGLKIQDGQ